MAQRVCRRLMVSVLLLVSGCGSAPSKAPAAIPAVRSTASLQSVFGPPSAAAFGSAVFVGAVGEPSSLEATALSFYRQFLGKQWAGRGESAWMSPWRRVYGRAQGDRRGIVAELKAIADPQARSSIGVLIDGHEHPDAARNSLSATYDDPSIDQVEVYTIGDGDALSGVLVAGRARNGTATVLAFLMD